jgi:hypothetical protein
MTLSDDEPPEGPAPGVSKSVGFHRYVDEADVSEWAANGASMEESEGWAWIAASLNSITRIWMSCCFPWIQFIQLLYNSQRQRVTHRKVPFIVFLCPLFPLFPLVPFAK